MRSSSLLPSVLFPTVYAQLNILAKAAGLEYFGSATDNRFLSDTDYVAILSNASEFGQVTPANSQKWDTVEPNPNEFSFEQGDVVASLAQGNGQLLRCHALVWHSQLPSWVSGGTWTKETLTEVIQNHVTQTVTHYKGKCHAWDVVNEVLNDDGTFRDSVFFNILGEDFIRIAFEAAAAADPDAKLHYNDFNIENAGPKATAALNIVKTLQAAGTKIDGVGLQSHFIVGASPSKEDLIATIEAYSSLGVEVLITELDIRMTLPVTDAQLQQQSTDYQNTVEACLTAKGCAAITVWDFADEYSWIPSVFPGEGAALPFDENLERKPAYNGIVTALQGANARLARRLGRSNSQITRSSY